MTELSLEIVLLVLAVVFSFFGSIFGFLRWRAGIIFDASEQEQILRERHVHSSRAYHIPVPHEADSDVEKYVMELSNPTCIKNLGWSYRIKSAVFGASGHTTASLRFTEVLKTTPSGEPVEFREGAPDAVNDVIDHPWYEDLGLVLSYPFQGNSIRVRFKTTDPEEIENILSMLTKILQQIVVGQHTDKSIMVRVDDSSDYSHP